MKLIGRARVGLLALLVLSLQVFAQAPPFSREELLSASVEMPLEVHRVVTQRIEMAPQLTGQKHYHPVPVVGYVVAGEIAFQIEGEDPQILKTGDAFFEPANAIIVRWENVGSTRAVFVAHYLATADSDELLVRIDSADDDSQPLADRKLRSAEALINAFYSFNPTELKPLLSHAASSTPTILYYQGWAEGGNYKIIDRKACTADSATVISCAITVEDDPVLALKIDFNVTDTFTMTFNGSNIVSVVTNSNDQQIYYDAFDWVTKEMPEVMAGPCLGFFNGGPTPGDCARAMTAGYRKFTNK